MPYINQEARKQIDGGNKPASAGELNYAITRVVSDYLGANPRYRDFNDAVGALESCKLEIYRRLIAPYENSKINENGDVFT